MGEFYLSVVEISTKVKLSLLSILKKVRTHMHSIRSALVNFLPRLKKEQTPYRRRGYPRSISDKPREIGELRFNGSVFSRTKIKLKERIKHNARPLVIVPVYNAFDETSQLLDRLKAEFNGQLLLIDDCSTDDRIFPLLREFQESDPNRVALIRNEENLGRLKSFNIGLRRALEENRIAVLLHSDTLLPEDWLPRLVEPIIADVKVATVTPFSNNGGLASAPFIGQNVELSECDFDRINIVARTLRKAAVDLTIPSAQNFCMAINPRFLKFIPQFDETFGSGYCEEIDWCQKASAIGGKHVLASDLFVYHKGSASFGESNKEMLLKRNLQLIHGRYPNFENEVENYPNQDAYASWRFILALTYLKTLPKQTIYFASKHMNEAALEYYFSEQMEADHGYLMVYVGGKMRWNLEIVTKDGRFSIGVDRMENMLRILILLNDAEVHFSSMGKTPNMLEDFELLKRLQSRWGARMKVIVREDFFRVNGQVEGHETNPEELVELWIHGWQTVAKMGETEFVLKSQVIEEKFNKLLPELKLTG